MTLTPLNELGVATGLRGVECHIEGVGCGVWVVRFQIGGVGYRVWGVRQGGGPIGALLEIATGIAPHPDNSGWILLRNKSDVVGLIMLTLALRHNRCVWEGVKHNTQDPQHPVKVLQLPPSPSLQCWALLGHSRWLWWES